VSVRRKDLSGAMLMMTSTFGSPWTLSLVTIPRSTSRWMDGESCARAIRTHMQKSAAIAHNAPLNAPRIAPRIEITHPRSIDVPRRRPSVASDPSDIRPGG
jgi:hypothetical protein